MILLSACLLMGCDTLRSIVISPKVNRIDYRAKTITLLTDNPLREIDIEKPESDYERIDSKKGIVFIGEWYKVEFYHSRSWRILVSIDENTESNERNLIVWAYRKKDSDAAIILQEGRPEE